MLNKKRGQVWIETVLYTLLGIALIGIVLGFVTPKINDSRDRLVIEQTVVSLIALDGKIKEVSQSQGNRRIYDLVIKRGSLYIDGENEEIFIVIDNIEAPYSEPGREADIGIVKVLTGGSEKPINVSLKIGFKDSSGNAYIDITYDNKNDLKKFTPSTTPYSFRLESFKEEDSDLIRVNLEEKS